MRLAVKFRLKKKGKVHITACRKYILNISEDIRRLVTVFETFHEIDNLMFREQSQNMPLWSEQIPTVIALQDQGFSRISLIDQSLETWACLAVCFVTFVTYLPQRDRVE